MLFHLATSYRVNKFSYHIFMYYECIRHHYSLPICLYFHVTRPSLVLCWFEFLLTLTGRASLKPLCGMDYVAMVIRLRKLITIYRLTEPNFSNFINNNDKLNWSVAYPSLFIFMVQKYVFI